MRSHSRASSRGSDFFDGAVSFHQDDGSFADKSEEDEVLEMPRRARRHSLSRLESLQKKCRLQFEDPFCDSKLVADSNVEQLLVQLQEHRVTLDSVNIDLFKKVHSVGVYFMSIDVQVCVALSFALCFEFGVLVLLCFHLFTHDAFLRTAPVPWLACSKYLLWPKVFLHSPPDGQLSFYQVRNNRNARCSLHMRHSLRMYRSRLLPQPLVRHQRVHTPSQHLVARLVHDDCCRRHSAQIADACSSSHVASQLSSPIRNCQRRLHIRLWSFLSVTPTRCPTPPSQ
jgi:hypothetical protein